MLPKTPNQLIALNLPQKITEKSAKFSNKMLKPPNKFTRTSGGI